MCLLIYIIVQSSAEIYLFKVNSKNTKKRCEIYSKLTIKTQEERYYRRFGDFGGFLMVSLAL